MKILFFVGLIVLIIVVFRQICWARKCHSEECTCDHGAYVKQIEKLNKIVNADKNIFDYMRCINVPQTPQCNTKDDGGNVCRSRQIDCNKFKLVLLNDPVAVERMKVATDLYDQTDKPKTLSELTYPVKSGWFY